MYDNCKLKRTHWKSGATDKPSGLVGGLFFVKKMDRRSMYICMWVCALRSLRSPRDTEVTRAQTYRSERTPASLTHGWTSWQVRVSLHHDTPLVQKHVQYTPTSTPTHKHTQTHTWSHRYKIAVENRIFYRFMLRAPVRTAILFYHLDSLRRLCRASVLICQNESSYNLPACVSQRPAQNIV